MRTLLIGLTSALALFAMQHAAAAEPAPADAAVSERSFLDRNAKREGVVVLPGLQYEVLKSGPPDGAHPLRSGEITVRYEGRFIDGKVFNTSPDQGGGTTVFPLQKLIPGWIAALQLMRPGDVWRLYIPAYLAYGSAGKSYIPPNATLIFKVELVAATAPADAEAPKPKS